MSADAQHFLNINKVFAENTIVLPLLIAGSFYKFKYKAIKPKKLLPLIWNCF